jgi:type II secretory pathway pseudopilin PulG
MKKLNNKGSTIITAIVVVMAVFIILSTVLMISKSYYNRSVNEHARKQAYLNGVSAADILAQKVTSDSSELIGKSDILVTLPSGYGGAISADINYGKNNENIIYIKVTSTYNKQVEEVQLTLQKKNGTWYKKVYSEIGETFDEESE